MFSGKDLYAKLRTSSRSYLIQFFRTNVQWFMAVTQFLTIVCYLGLNFQICLNITLSWRRTFCPIWKDLVSINVHTCVCLVHPLTYAEAAKGQPAGVWLTYVIRFFLCPSLYPCGLQQFVLSHNVCSNDNYNCIECLDSQYVDPQYIDLCPQWSDWTTKYDTVPRSLRPQMWTVSNSFEDFKKIFLQWHNQCPCCPYNWDVNYMELRW